MKTRKRLRKGGAIEKYRFFAIKMKNKEYINSDDFKVFLDSVRNPLQTAIDYDGNGTAYTINEYALLHDAGNDIQSLFWLYDTNLGHLANYASLIGVSEPLTLLEAHIIYGKYGENIRCIIEQIYKDLPNCVQYLFRLIQRTRGIPTVLYFALESSNYVLDPLDKPIYDIIMQTYYGNNIYQYLTKNNSLDFIKELVTLGIRFNKPDFLSTVLLKVGNSETIVKLVFNNAAVSFLLLQNNKELFLTTFNVLRRLDQTVVLRNISHSEELLQAYNVKKDAKQFFSSIGKQTLTDVLPPNVDKKVRIIIRCHGIVQNLEKQRFAFPFDRLCFFVNAGETLGETCALGETCIVSNRTEAMICNGNYDAETKCIQSENEFINTEPIKFVFDSGFFIGKRNMFTGIYVCSDGETERADVLDINEDIPYEINDIVGFCLKVCEHKNIDPKNVDIMLFSCRSLIGQPQTVKRVNPKVVA